MSCCKTKKLYQSKPFVWVCSLYQSTHTHPVPNGQCKCKSRVRAVGVVECGGSPRFFLVGSCGDSAPGFSLFSFSFDRIRQDFHSPPFDQFWQISTTTKSPNFRHCSTPTFIDKFRHSPCQISTNFDLFSFSISLDQFRQTLYFRASHYYYMPIIQKVYIFLIDKFRACSPFFFVTSQFYYNTKIFYFQPHI